MHTIQLKIDDSIYDKFMGLLDTLPKDKVEITSDKDYPSISFEEAKKKVERAINNISLNEGTPLDEAIGKVFQS